MVFLGFSDYEKGPLEVFTYRFLCAHIFSFLVAKRQGVEFLGYMKCMVHYSRSFPAVS